MVRIEPADQLIQIERCFPDVEEEIATGTSASNGATAIYSRIVSFVPAATAVKLTGADLQAASGLGLLDLFADFAFALNGGLEVTNALAEAFRHFRNLLAAKKENCNAQNHQEFGHSDIA